MHHAAGHADTHNAETACAIQYIHDCQAEQTACKRVEHAENSGKKQPGAYYTHAVDGKGVLEAHSVNGNNDYQISQPQLYARYGNRKGNQKFHIGKNHGKGGEHGTESQSSSVL